MSLLLKNPHSVLAVLEARPKDVLEICLPPKTKTETWEGVESLARKLGITPRTNSAQKHASNDAGRAGSAFATVKERAPVPLETLFQSEQATRDQSEGHGLWLALDSLTDPQNVGALFRSAAFFKVKGIVMTQDRSAPLSSVVYDVAVGGMESVPFAIEVNLQRVFEKAKDRGIWVLGSSEHATDSYSSIQRDRPWLLVLGNEEKGMRRLTEENCDVLCRIPGRGQVTSLNVSVAGGILISHFCS